MRCGGARVDWVIGAFSREARTRSTSFKLAYTNSTHQASARFDCPRGRGPTAGASYAKCPEFPVRGPIYQPCEAPREPLVQRWTSGRFPGKASVMPITREIAGSNNG